MPSWEEEREAELAEIERKNVLKRAFLASLPTEADRIAWIEAKDIEKRSGMWYSARTDMLDLVKEQVDGKWGFIVIRTTYKPGSDKEFLNAMRKLDQWVYSGLLSTYNHQDRIPLAQDIFARFENTIIETPIMDDASIWKVNQLAAEFLAHQELGLWPEGGLHAKSFDHWVRWVIHMDADAIAEINSWTDKQEEQIEITKWDFDLGPKVTLNGISHTVGSVGDRHQHVLADLWSMWYEKTIGF